MDRSVRRSRWCVVVLHCRRDAATSAAEVEVNFIVVIVVLVLFGCVVLHLLALCG